jgi:hypothetical protein
VAPYPDDEKLFPALTDTLPASRVTFPYLLSRAASRNCTISSPLLQLTTSFFPFISAGLVSLDYQGIYNYYEGSISSSASGNFCNVSITLRVPFQPIMSVPSLFPPPLPPHPLSSCDTQLLPGSVRGGEGCLDPIPRHLRCGLVPLLSSQLLHLLASAAADICR